MNRWMLIALMTMGLAACGSQAPSPAAGAATPEESGHEGHDHGPGGGHEDEEGHDHEEGEPDFAKIDPAKAAENGIHVAKAAAGVIDEAVILTGRLIIDPRRVAAVRARFPGPVVAIAKDVGEPVRRGETLARVESNESLTTYNVVSPLDGVVLARTTNVGDVAGSDSLFEVGDVSALQAELQAFTATRALLRIGGAARIQIDEETVPGRIVSLAPQLEGQTQARVIRVALETRPRGSAAPGQFVTGQLASGSSQAAAVAVPADAVRRLEGRDVVFIPEETGYRARAVKVGRKGLAQIEILEGLDAGEEYVDRGTFILKAEIGKNLAAHEH